MIPLESQLAGALYRINVRIDALTALAHAEHREMLESARRSLGQRIRWARFRIFGPACPAVFRYRRKE